MIPCVGRFLTVSWETFLKPWWAGTKQCTKQQFLELGYIFLAANFGWLSQNLDFPCPAFFHFMCLAQRKLPLAVQSKILWSSIPSPQLHPRLQNSQLHFLLLQLHFLLLHQPLLRVSSKLSDWVRSSGWFFYVILKFTWDFHLRVRMVHMGQIASFGLNFSLNTSTSQNRPGRIPMLTINWTTGSMTDRSYRHNNKHLFYSG